MFNYLQKKGVLFAILCCILTPVALRAQDCDGLEGPLPDTPVPVTGVNSSNPEVHCFYFRFDSDIAGWPTGITMDLWHEYEGDLSIWVEACGERLNVMQRPGAVNNCDADCAFDQDNGDCGSSEMIGTQDTPEIVSFYTSGTDPEGGVSSGGTFGLTADDGCGVGTPGTNSFADLWSNCPEGLVEAEICFADHATLHAGYVSNLDFIFPNPYTCGCMDPDAVNYDPDAGVSNGNCLYECPELGLLIHNSDTTLCSGGATFALSASAPPAVQPEFEWYGSGLGTDFLTDLEGSTTTVELPVDFVGTITYTCLVRDAFDCQELETVNVTVLPAPNVAIIGNTELCAGDSTQLSLNGGPYLSIAWSTGATTSTIPAGSGTYSVTVSTGGPCTASDTITIAALPVGQPVITGQDTICLGDSTLLNANAGFLSYLWSTGDTLSSAMVSGAQTYGLTVTDANGCTADTTFTLANYPNTPLMISGSTVFCQGDTLTLNATPGYASYLWSNGDTLPTLQLTQADTLMLTAIDSSGCTAQASVIVEELPLPTPAIMGAAFLCPGETVTLAADAVYATYLWSTGSTDSLIMTDTAGVFELTVQDSLGCSATTTFTVSNAVEPAPVIQGEPLFCVGDSTLLSVASGFADYLWSNGATTNATYFANTGLAFVTVTNVQGCSATASLTLENHPPETLIIDGPAEICTGAEAELQAAPGYTDYVWSDGTTGPTLLVSTADVYTVSALSANGCAVSGSFALNVRPEPTVAITGETEICADGSTVLTADPGFSTYRWSEDSETASITVNQAQTYTVTVTDELGCTTAAEATVTLSELEVSIIGDERFCVGENTTLAADGTYTTYLWSTDDDTPTITTTTAGDYGLTVTNVLGCTATGQFTVSVDALPQPTITGEPSFCEGTGTIFTSAQTYAIYAWSVPGQTDQQLTVDTAGSYGLTVTDENGCQGSTEVIASILSAPSPEIIGEPGFCPGESTELSSAAPYVAYTWSNGTNTISTTTDVAETLILTVTDTNGCQGSTSVNTGPYAVTTPVIAGDLAFCAEGTTTLSINDNYTDYLWSTGASTASIEADTPGTIGITVTDGNGCTTNTSAELNLFPEEALAILGPDAFCPDAATTLNASGNFVSYLWSTGATTASISVAEAGPVSLVGTDANGCTSSAATELSIWPAPAPDIIGSPTFCAGLSTELFTDQPYATYTWSNQTNAASVTIDTPGPLGLTVTDTNGCTGSTAVTVEVADGLSPQLNELPGICPDENGVLSLTENYTTYTWSDGSTADTLLVSAPGHYAVSVTDAAGCAGAVELEVIGFAAPEAEIVGAEDFCMGTSITLTAQISNGTILWNDGTTESSIIVNASGAYGFVFTDENGCQISTEVSVQTLALPNININGDGFFCIGDVTELTATPGYATYEWSTGADTDAITISTPGPVGVTVTDNAGCSNTDAVQINEIEPPLAVAGMPDPLDCATEAVTLGSDATTQGDVTYTWIGPGITPTNADQLQPEVSIAGLYTLQVTDDLYGCLSNIAEVEVTDLRYEPTIEVELLDTLDCTTSVVTIDGTGTVTGSQYTYQWYDEAGVIAGATEPALETAVPGMYTLVVLDTVTACFNAAEVMVVADAAYPPVSAGVDQLLDCAVEVVTLTGSVDAPGAMIVQEWSTPDGLIIGDPSELTIMTTTPGWYYLTATDPANGCTNVDSVLVDQDITSPVATNTGDMVLDCNDESAVLSGQGSSQGGNFTYQWWLAGSPIPGATAIVLPAATPGQYQLIVTNTENACTATTTVALNIDPNAPQQLSLAFDPPTCAGDQDGSIQVAEVTGGMPPYLYSLDGQPYQAGTFYPALGAGSYTLTVEDADGCQLSSAVDLPDGNDLWVELGENDTVWVGEPFDLYPQVSINPFDLARSEWSPVSPLDCLDCFNQEDIRITQTTNFFLTVTDENGCFAEDVVTIFVRKRDGIFTPNIFSPNGDGSNDTFYLQTDGQTIEEIRQMAIFDRWGENVFIRQNFQPDDPSLGWGGTFRGETLNPNVFVWFAEVELTSGEVITLKGDVVLAK